MTPLDQDEKNRLFMTLDAINAKQDQQNTKIDRLERGMYGDEQLKQAGLIDDMIAVKNWIVAAKAKITFFAGVGTAIGFAVAKAWEWFVGKH